MIFSKKGQIGAFVIVGLVILLSVGLYLYISGDYIRDVSDPVETITEVQQLFPIEKYVGYCLESELLPLVKTLAFNGGTLDLVNKSTIEVDGAEHLMLYDVGYGNYFLSRKSVESELNEALLERLDICINIADYEMQGYEVVDGPKKLNVTIADNDVVVDLNYEISVSKGDSVSYQSEFTEIVSISLGEMLDDIVDIVNAEVENRFDLDYYRLLNREFSVVKRMPYPNNFFVLSTKQRKGVSNYLEFNFGVEDFDLSMVKFSKPESFYERSPRDGEGSCWFGNTCFSFGKEMKCLEKGGEFSMGQSCAVENTLLDYDIIERLLNDSDVASYVDSSNIFDYSCTEWYDVYTGELQSGLRFNGESWCSFEPGVGGRFYKMSCVEGSVVVEQCADFKNEVCADSVINLNTDYYEGQFSYATCRPNRFWSCNLCDGEECCLNSDMRDCVWSDAVGCYPVAEPGFKFWDFSAAEEVCFNSVVATGNNLDDTNKKNCYSSGDCGSKYNYLGQYSSGFYSKDTLDDREFYSDLSVDQSGMVDKLEVDIGSYSEEFSVQKYESLFESSSLNFIEVLNRYVRNIDELMVFSLNDYLDPQIDMSFEDISTFSCTPWSSLSVSRCDSCNSYANALNGSLDYSECTEYKCRSLGNDCMFEMDDGVPNCYSPSDDGVPIEITSVIPEGYDYEVVDTKLGKGIMLKDDIELFEPLRLRMNTNKDALCKLGYLPDKSYDELSNSDLSDMEFSKVHSVSLSFTHEFDVFGRVLEYFNEPSYSSLLGTLVDLRYKLEGYQRSFPDLVKYKIGVFPLLSPLVDYYLDTSTQDKLDVIFRNLDEGNFYIFMKCIDKSGRETEDFFFNFELADPCEDSDAPVILDTFPRNNGITKGDLYIYVDELSECRYDTSDTEFELMKYNLECEKNPYAVSGIANGSYLCSGELGDGEDLFMSADSVDLFVKCRDHPEFDLLGYKYAFGITKALDYEYINNESFRGHNVTVFNTTRVVTADLSNLVEDLEYGSFDLGVPTVGQDFIEIIFNRPMKCNSTLATRCSSSRCVVEMVKNTDYFPVSCEYVVPNCPSFISNYADDSYEFTVSKRLPLEITVAYVNQNFLVSYEDNTDSDVDCGIELERDGGFVKMNKKLGYDVFEYSYSRDRIGDYSARVFCVNRFGDQVLEEVVYRIDE